MVFHISRSDKMSVPSKIHNIQLVQIQPEERLAATSERNLASRLVTGCGEVRGMGYWAATQVNGLSPCSEAICRPCGSKSCRLAGEVDKWRSQSLLIIKIKRDNG